MFALNTLGLIGTGRAGRRIWPAAGLVATSILMAHAQPALTPRDASAVTVDRIVAVVNRQPILSSDIEDEFRIVVLDPSRAGASDLTPQQALQRLISRTLIQQQIGQEGLLAANPNAEEVAARVKSLQNDLPECIRRNCSSDSGWKEFLARHDLTQEKVEVYLRNRIRILRFIELRFRQGIRIAPEEIEAYYREKLLPLYAPGQKPPPLAEVAPRIEEIILQEQVNVLLGDWLDNLREQGEIEVLDPAFEPVKAEESNSKPSTAEPDRRIAKKGSTSE